MTARSPRSGSRAGSSARRRARDSSSSSPSRRGWRDAFVRAWRTMNGSSDDGHLPADRQIHGPLLAGALPAPDPDRGAGGAATAIAVAVGYAIATRQPPEG